MHDEEVAAEGQLGGEAQAAVGALRGGVVGPVLRYVLLEAAAVLGGEAALGATELRLRPLRRGGFQGGAARSLPDCILPFPLSTGPLWEKWVFAIFRIFTQKFGSFSLNVLILHHRST